MSEHRCPPGRPLRKLVTSVMLPRPEIASSPLLQAISLELVCRPLPYIHLPVILSTMGVATLDTVVSVYD